MSKQVFLEEAAVASVLHKSALSYLNSKEVKFVKDLLSFLPYMASRPMCLVGVGCEIAKLPAEIGQPGRE